MQQNQDMEYNNREFMIFNVSELPNIDFNEVLEMQADYLEETGKNKEAEELRNATVSYFLDLETFFDYYSLFNKSELAKYLGINPSHLRRLSSASVELSEKKALQIKNGLHKLATELQQYNFA